MKMGRKRYEGEREDGKEETGGWGGTWEVQACRRSMGGGKMVGGKKGMGTKKRWEVYICVCEYKFAHWSGPNQTIPT